MLKKQPSTRVFVVDASATDYDHLRMDEWDGEVQIVHFRTGRDALRCNPEETPTMWLINTRLPDMSGTTLHDMLRARGCQHPIGLIGEEYRVEDEMAARISGASFYVAKPLPAEMIECMVAT